MRRRVLVAVAMWVAAGAIPAFVHAQVPPGCVAEDSSEIVTSPPDRALHVALDAPINIRVLGDDHPAFALFREPDAVSDAGQQDAGPTQEQRVPVPARWQRIGETNRFVVRPEQDLDPDTTYAITVDTKTGLHADRSFTTGASVDSGPPMFAFGPQHVTEFSSAPIPRECGEDGDSRRISLRFENATDDANAGGIEYFLYLTRASGLASPRLLTRQYLAEGTAMTFLLTPDEVKTPVCVVVDAIDGVGNHADVATIKEYCFDPLQGNFFEPCSVGGPVTFAQVGLFLAYMIAVMFALSVRIRRLRRRDMIGACNGSSTQR